MLSLLKEKLNYSTLLWLIRPFIYVVLQEFIFLFTGNCVNVFKLFSNAGC